MNIGFTFDLEIDYVYKKGDPPDAHAEFDRVETIDKISSSLKQLGHRVIRIGNIYHLLANLESIKKSVDIVFNIAEGATGRNREAQIPLILEMMRIPFVGADALTQAVTLDKFITKQILTAEKISTPKYSQISNSKQITEIHLDFPLMVKPRWEGSSKGISKKSYIENIQQLQQQVAYIITTYKQPALVEEFIRGKEYTVGIIGNSEAKTLPILKVEWGKHKSSGNEFYLGEYVYNDYVEYVQPQDINPKMKQKILDIALKTYRAVECRDFGRIDIRIDKKGKIFVLEINPLPSLDETDAFSKLGEYLGVGYTGIIKYILESALMRYGLKSK